MGSLDTTVGTQRTFPYECTATNNLIHECGMFGKQAALHGVLARLRDLDVPLLAVQRVRPERT